MKTATRIHLLASLFVPVVALAGTVGSETTQGTDTKQSQSIEKSESIQLRKGKTKRDTTGSDRRAAEERGKEKRQSEDISAEMQGGALFVPLLQEIEHGQVDTGGNKVAELIQHCGFFTVGPATVAAVEPSPEMMSYLSGGKVANVSVQGGGAVARVRVTGAYITRRFDWYPQVTAFVLDSPRNVARCYFAYGLTVRNAMRNLAQGAQVRETPLKEKVVLVRGDLQERAATALVAALRAPGLMEEINRNTITVTSDDCMLPTVFGLMGGNKGWQCGPLNVDPNQVQANLGNLAVLAENQFMGQRITFAQVAGQSTSARSTDSRSTYSSADNSNESGQDVSMAKRRSSSRDQSATTGSSGKADTNASPK